MGMVARIVFFYIFTLYIVQLVNANNLLIVPKADASSPCELNDIPSVVGTYYLYKMKECRKCHQIKDFLFFNKNKNAKDGLHVWCKSCDKEYTKKYQLENPEKVKLQNSQYHKTRREKYSEKVKEGKRRDYLKNKSKRIAKINDWVEKNIDRVKANRRNYYLKNKEELDKKNKISYYKNRDKYLAIARKRYLAEKEKQLLWHKEYRKMNREKINVYKRQYDKNRRETDFMFRLIKQIRSRTCRIFRKMKFNKTISSKILIGIEFDELRKYIESKFTDGMNWENYGKWHIDHIYPLSLAKTKEELMILCHYTNLQPLWALDNIKKGTKLNYSLQTV